MIKEGIKFTKIYIEIIIVIVIKIILQDFSKQNKLLLSVHETYSTPPINNYLDFGIA